MSEEPYFDERHKNKLKTNSMNVELSVLKVKTEKPKILVLLGYLRFIRLFNLEKPKTWCSNIEFCNPNIAGIVTTSISTSISHWGDNFLVHDHI